MALITSIDCVLPRPDITELHNQLTAELSKRLLGGAPVYPMSAEDVLAAVMAGAVNLTHGYVTQVLKENDPATMCCDNLVLYGARHGINLLGATRAKGYVALTGVGGTPIPTDLRLSGAEGTEYKNDPAVTFNPVSLDPAGGAVVRVVAALPGEHYNVPAGTILTVATTYPGLDMAATVVGGGIAGGTSDEDCEALRLRILAAERAGAIATNQEWFCQQTLAYPGVTRCCFDECDQCCGPMTIYPFYEGVYGDANLPPMPPADGAPYGVPPQAVLDLMTEWMFGNRPGMGEGLAPFGCKGSYCSAAPTMLTVRAYCFQGCPTGARDRMIAALQTYIRSQTCVGTPVCKQQLLAVASGAAGLENCFSAVLLEFDGTLDRHDQAFAYLACGHFLVLQDVVLETTPPPRPPRGIYADQVSILGDGLPTNVLRVDLVDGGVEP